MTRIIGSGLIAYVTRHMLPHLSGVLHLHVNRPLVFIAPWVLMKFREGNNRFRPFHCRVIFTCVQAEKFNDIRK